MPVIYTRSQRMHAFDRQHTSRRTVAKKLAIIGGVLIGAVLAINAALLLIYRERTYPRTTVMNAAIGNIAYEQLAARLEAKVSLPRTITLRHDNTMATVPTAELGIQHDTAPTIASAKTRHNWLPIIGIFRKHTLVAPVHLDTSTLNAKANELTRTFSQPTQDARLVFDGGTVHIAGGKPGYTLNKSALGDAIIETLARGTTTVDVPVLSHDPKVKTDDLKAAKQTIEAQLNTPIQLRYNDKTIQPSREERVQWYAASDTSNTSYAPSVDNITQYLIMTGNSLGVHFGNNRDTAQQIANALTNNKPLDIALTVVPAAKTFTYCTATKNVSTAELPTLRQQLRLTYSDARGWALDGNIAFKEVSENCDFTVWLSAADQMPTFGAICDSMWSCRVGRNVVINFDRWQNASPAWNKQGGSLQDYRHMVINHETGHWLGFGHAYCPGRGQLAPVMQQQSIDLQGCNFNPWPTTNELNALRQKLGI